MRAEVADFMLGAVAMGFFVAGLFFFRFWRETRDTLFALFALSFWAEAVNRTAFALSGDLHENRFAFYVLRLITYLLIIAGIIAKNIKRE